MLYTIKNTFLTVTIDSLGAQMVSVKNDKGEETLWQADKSVWGYSAPVLFPWVGRLKDGHFTVEGEEFSAGNHGFIRNVEHTLVLKEDNLIIFEYKANAESRKKFPHNFVFRTSFVLSGHSVHHKIDVTNIDSRDFHFGLGFHPGFRLPFDDIHTTEDYCIEFDTPQSPVEMPFAESLLLSGESRVYAENVKQLPLKDNFFENDTLIFKDLTAKTVSIVEKDSGRRIDFDVQDFPYVALWTAKTPKTKFFCVEPWCSLPDYDNSSHQWESKKHGMHLKPGEACHTLCRIKVSR